MKHIITYVSNPCNTNGRCVVAKEIMEDKSIRVKVVTFPGQQYSVSNNNRLHAE